MFRQLLIYLLRPVSFVLSLLIKPLTMLPKEKLSTKNRRRISHVFFFVGKFQYKVRLFGQALTSFEFSFGMQYNVLDENLIIFEAYQGAQYACSPRALYENMLGDERFKNFSFIWVLKQPEKSKSILKNERTTIVKYNSWDATQHYRRAKYWIVNFRLPPAVIKRHNQIMVQCWHGTPYKKIGLDISVNRAGAKSSLQNISFDYKLDAMKYDYFLSPSRFASEKFISAFNLKELGKEHIIVEEGYPRNDYLFTYSSDDVRRVKEDLRIPENKKVILYAPTWRDDQYKMGSGYQFKSPIDFTVLQEQIGDDFVVLYRTHYFVNDSLVLSKHKDFVYDVSRVDNINELYIISDMLITDYSSVFFDYANLRRPIIFYMHDYDNYKSNLRDFYLTLEQLPGNVVKTESALVKVIQEVELYPESFVHRVDEFNTKFNSLEDGKASERVISHIFKKDKDLYR